MRPLAIVTGASRGLGARFAEVLSKDYDLIVIARDMEALNTLKLDSGCHCKTFALDLTEDTAIEQVLQTLEDDGRIPTLLVNNAGFGYVGGALEETIEAQCAMIDLNVRALTQMSLAIAARMKTVHAGKILNVASIASFTPCPQMAVYAATKAYVRSFSESLSIELKDAGVTVTSVCPGPVDTAFWSRAGLDETRKLSQFMTPADQVVREALEGLYKHRVNVTAGFTNRVLESIVRFAPRGVSRFLAKRLLEKLKK